jgi:hypothetical protein
MTWTDQDQEQFDMIVSGSTASCEEERIADKQCLDKVGAMLRSRQAVHDQLKSVKTWAEIAKYDIAAFGALELSIEHLEKLMEVGV